MNAGSAMRVEAVQARDRLAPPPATPNAVSSQCDRADRVHFIEPFRFSGKATDAWTRLIAVVGGMPRARIVMKTDDRMHAEFRSRTFGFVDDAEFVLDSEAGVIHLRSAARLGYSDLGVNRRRAERIREAAGFLRG